MSDATGYAGEELPPCPECSSEYTYETGALLTCPMCGHEWERVPDDVDDAGSSRDDAAVRDAVGNVLSDGDTVSVIKGLRVSGGGGGTIKAGTKVTGIRLVTDTGDGHDIEARVPGFGRMKLKSSVVKRA